MRKDQLERELQWAENTTNEIKRKFGFKKRFNKMKTESQGIMAKYRKTNDST